MTGLIDVLKSINASLGLNTAQAATASRFIGVADLVGAYYIASALGPYGLIVSDYGTLAGHSLPPDQW